MSPQEQLRGRGVPIFGARKRAQELDEENAWLRQQLATLGALDHIELARQRDDLGRQRDDIAAQVQTKRHELDRLAAEIVATSDLAALQEVGVYQYRHPLENAEQYKAARERISEQIKAMAKDGQAIEAATSWTVNNSAAQGRAMVRDLSKLMLRAYNAEAENCVRTMRAGNLSVAVKRLEKAVWTIARLGKIMSIRVAPAYHQLRIQELELVADYQAKLAEEKEAERAERERLREEAKARREYEQEQERLTNQGIGPLPQCAGSRGRWHWGLGTPGQDRRNRTCHRGCAGPRGQHPRRLRLCHQQPRRVRREDGQDRADPPPGPAGPHLRTWRRLRALPVRRPCAGIQR
jgi:hypothetical protein